MFIINDEILFLLTFQLKYQQFSANHRWYYPQGRQTLNEAHSALSEKALSKVIDPEPGLRGLPQTSTHNPQPGRYQRQIPSSQGSKASITKFFSLFVKQEETGTAVDREKDGSSVDGGSYLDVAPEEDWRDSSEKEGSKDNSHSDEVEVESKNLSFAHKIRAPNQKIKGLNDTGEEHKSDTDDDENDKHSDVHCASDDECKNYEHGE